MQRTKLFILLLWLAALSLAGWTLTKLPISDLTHSIALLSTTQWLLWLTLNGLIIAVLGLRWQILTQALSTRMHFLRLLVIRQAGQAVSFITPGPQFGGEPLQIYWLFKNGIPLRKAVLSLALDRFFELWVNFSILLVAVLLILIGLGNSDINTSTNAIDEWQSALIPLLTFLGLMAGFAWLLIKQPRWINHRLERLTARWQHNHRLSSINQHWQSIGDDLRIALRTQKIRFLAAMILSLIGWAGLLGELYLILDFVGVEADLYSFLVILIAMRMALLLPMPGGVGTLEASVLWSFQTLSLPASAALGLIALIRLRDLLILLIGMMCLRASKCNSATIEKESSKKEFLKKQLLKNE